MSGKSTVNWDANCVTIYPRQQLEVYQIKQQIQDNPLSYSPGQLAVTHNKSIAVNRYTTCLTEFLTGPTCLLCLNIVSQPIDLSKCSSLVSSECCCEWLRQIDTSHSTIRQAGGLTMELLRATCTCHWLGGAWQVALHQPCK